MVARMSAALDTTSFRGTLVHVRGDTVDNLKVIHRVGPDGVRERIFALDGPQREVLRDRDVVRCLLADEGSVLVPNQLLGGMRALTAPPLIGDSSMYEFRSVGPDRVAGLNADLVELVPLDSFRYGHRIWLDQGSGLMLRAVLIDDEGQNIQQLSFVTIELDAEIDDRELEPGFDHPLTRRLQEINRTETARERSAQDLPRWMPTRLPKGFVLAYAGTVSGPSGSAMEHLVFTDGVASVSVYVESGGRVLPVQGIEAVGPLHVYTGRLDDRIVTVVGEVPPGTVALFGKSLRRAAYPVLEHFE